jgi:DNA-binding NarL/FixJ family response regulator
VALTRVLIVEDHRFFSEAFQLLLGQGLSKQDPDGDTPTFSVASTLAEGLKLASDGGPFELAVVDLMLPDGDGTEVVRKLKALAPSAPVAVLSSVEDLSGSLKAGANEAISKAVALPEIIATLCRMASEATGLRPALED